MSARAAWFLTLVLFVPAGLNAASGDLSLGGQVVGSLSPAEVGAGASVDLGLTQFFKLRASLQGRFRDGPEVLMGTAGLVLVFDVLTWVPELALEGGVRWRDTHVAPVAAMSVGVRRYLSLQWSLGLQAGVLWHHSRIQPNVLLGAYYDFL